MSAVNLVFIFLTGMKSCRLEISFLLICVCNHSGVGYTYDFTSAIRSEVNSFRSPHKLVMLFTSSRRSDISRRCDFTHVKMIGSEISPWREKLVYHKIYEHYPKWKVKLQFDVCFMKSLLFLWESLFWNPFCCMLSWQRWQREKNRFYGFFNNIWKHQHYKAVLNMYPILWNNYRIEGKEFRKRWNDWTNDFGAGRSLRR